MHPLIVRAGLACAVLVWSTGAFAQSSGPIEFQTPNMWESYRAHVIATVAVVMAQLALIAGLLLHRTKRRGAEQMLREREVTLRSSYDRIRSLNWRLFNAQETARAEM